MQPQRLTLALLLVVSATVGWSCKNDGPPQPAKATASSTSSAPALDVAQVRALFKALPARFDTPQNQSTPEKIDLGRMLYFDTRFSRGHDLSCNSCHRLDRGGVDGERFSKGHKGQLGARNSPTVFNAAGHIAQFWDGRAADVEEQAKGPVLNPVEMAMPDGPAVVDVLRSIPGYVIAFQRAFPGEKEPITYDNFGRAIGSFERGLVTPSRFDAFLSGNDTSLDDREKLGLSQFISVGCANCHSGALLGGTMYMKMGSVHPYDNTTDQGRFDVTKNEADRMLFKVPSLRNVADTAPYFHDGAATELPTAVRTMARLQLGKQLSDDEVASIVSFLRTLSGAPPKDYIATPALPPSGPKTRGPDTR